MSQSTERIERLLEEQLGECCDADVKQRIAELESLADALPTETAAERRALKTLGDETRYRLARLLAAADRELCVCELAPMFDVSESAVSHALADLTDADLVTRRKDGTWHYYETTARAEEVLAALDATRSEIA
jgi:ArsR family transcriptional regulator